MLDNSTKDLNYLKPDDTTQSVKSSTNLVTWLRLRDTEPETKKIKGRYYLIADEQLVINALGHSLLADKNLRGLLLVNPKLDKTIGNNKSLKKLLTRLHAVRVPVLTYGLISENKLLRIPNLYKAENLISNLAELSGEALIIKLKETLESLPTRISMKAKKRLS